jgi:P27 family predicted phage terminase small subunit
MLLQMRVLTEADQIALAELCQSYSSMLQAQQSLSKSGLLVKMNGTVMPHPLIWVVNRYRDQVLKMLREFGLTPASRSRINMESDFYHVGQRAMDGIEAALCNAPKYWERNNTTDPKKPE